MNFTTSALLLRDEGQGLAEYGIILGFVAMACLAAVSVFSGHLQSILSSVGSQI